MYFPASIVAIIQVILSLIQDLQLLSTSVSRFLKSVIHLYSFSRIIISRLLFKKEKMQYLQLSPNVQHKATMKGHKFREGNGISI